MPELSRFYVVRIKMYYDDHNPPHFHAEYGGDEALISIDTLDVIGGDVPSRALGSVGSLTTVERKNDKKDCFFGKETGTAGCGRRAKTWHRPTV